MAIIRMDIDHIGLTKSDFDEMRRNRVGRILVAYGYRPKCRGRWARPGKDDSPSMHVFPHGTWYDHRNPEKNDCSPKALIQWLESQGYSGNPDQLTEAELQIAQNADNFAQPSSTDDKSLWAIHRWNAAKPVKPTDEDSIQAEIHNHQVESVRQYFHGRGLSTQWWSDDHIRVYGLQTAVGMEKTMREQGADLAFAIPMSMWSAKNGVQICGIQRTVLPYQDELAEARYDSRAWRKAGRIMLGNAGFTYIKIPQDPDPSEYGGALSGESLENFLISIGYTGQQRIAVVSEGLESGLSVAQQLPNAIVNVMHSASQMRKVGERLLNLAKPLASDNGLPTIVLVAADHDQGMVGQKAAAFFTRVVRQLGNPVFYLDPAREGEDKFDWNDSLANGRIGEDLLRAVANAEANLESVPLGQNDLALVSRANTVAPLGGEDEEIVHPDCPRPVYSLIGIVRETLGITMNQTTDHTMRLTVGEVSTGVGKSSALANIKAGKSAADKTVICTPQKRDADRIARGNGYDKPKHRRHGRTNRFHEIQEELLDTFFGWTKTDEELVWTSDCTLTTQEQTTYSAASLADLIREATMSVSGPELCYRGMSPSEDPQLGTYSHKSGDMYPNALAAQGHPVAPHCTRECPHGIHAVALFAKSHEKQEELLEQEAMHVGPYQTSRRKDITSAKIRQFLPCPGVYNRLESYQKPVVVATNGTSETDKRLSGGAKHLHYDENPAVFDSREFDWKMREQVLRSSNKKMRSIQNRINHLPQAGSDKQIEKERARLEKILFYLSVVRDGIAFFKDRLDEARYEITNVTIRQFFAENEENIAAFIKAVKWLKKENALPDKPYRASKDSHQMTIPKAFLEYFAEALELKTLYVVGGKVMFFTRTDATQNMLDISRREQSDKPKIRKLTISVWSATPDISIDKITQDSNKMRFHV
ncbi:hypothetical protein HFU84_05050 [Acidithiobacillus sp. CV18-2]|nr:hypothetical protein [Acidithiobacillus sp. CV18-3]MBU2758310.1 hypothetical protein [Acidithiobacillus sp. BN09-2]MBU2776884.1 hypothetical protein [Acidithiobacillus sp. CV18-2]MBU2800388.1 hypothetical protein [Acidithiobacillus sp. VAN18-4]